MGNQKENGNGKEFRSRKKKKEIHIEIMPDESQIQAVRFIKMFGLTEPPVFVNVLKVKEDEML